MKVARDHIHNSQGKSPVPILNDSLIYRLTVKKGCFFLTSPRLSDSIFVILTRNGNTLLGAEDIILCDNYAISLITGSFHSIPSVAEGKFRDTNHVVV